MDCVTLGSAVFAVVDHLEEELVFAVPVGLDGSGFLVVTDVVAVVGFLATAAEGGRLTSADKEKYNKHSQLTQSYHQ